MGINRVNLVGRLGRDPEFHYIEKNTAISRLRLAVSDGYDANGNKGQHTLWVNVVLWNRLAFVGKNGLRKGAAVAVEGKLSNRCYVDKEGIKRYALEVDAESIECISKPKATSAKTEGDDSGDETADNVEIIDEETGEIMPFDEEISDMQDCEEEKPLSIKDVEDPKKSRRKKK